MHEHLVAETFRTCASGNAWGPRGSLYEKLSGLRRPHAAVQDLRLLWQVPSGDETAGP